jgi:hypothetical protein
MLWQTVGVLGERSHMAAFHHHDLRLLNPAFDSPLVDVVTELEHLRRLRLGGSTPAPVFYLSAPIEL